jgi:hypothetical protein
MRKTYNTHENGKRALPPWLLRKEYGSFKLSMVVSLWLISLASNLQEAHVSEIRFRLLIFIF